MHHRSSKLFILILVLASNASFGQKRTVIGTFYTSGSYSGPTLTFKPDMTFTLKYQGHLSSDTAAGSYKVVGDTISLTYDYNNYENIFKYYKEQKKQVPVDIQLAASRVGIRPKTLIKKHSKLYIIDIIPSRLLTWNNKLKKKVFLSKIE